MVKRRIIEIPSDGVVRIPIIYGEVSIGERRIDLSHYPVIDAVEVMHGRWEKFGYDLRCSACGVYQCGLYMGMTNYCPNCGAKMDLE